MKEAPEDRLAKLMKEKGWTQQSLADLLGVSRQSIGHYLTKTRRINNLFALALAYKTNINPEWLMEGKGKP
jgi:transcriptional regulator with XRE-family HTH domain